MERSETNLDEKLEAVYNSYQEDGECKSFINVLQH